MQAAEDSRGKVGQLAKIAGDLGVSTGQLALGWVAANPNVSTVILGASSVEQLQENLGALSALKALEDADLKAKIDEIFA